MVRRIITALAAAALFMGLGMGTANAAPWVPVSASTFYVSGNDSNLPLGEVTADLSKNTNVALQQVSSCVGATCIRVVEVYDSSPLCGGSTDPLDTPVSCASVDYSTGVCTVQIYSFLVTDYPDAAVYALKHEIGAHCLGAGHVSEAVDPRSIFNPSSSYYPRSTVLTSGDRKLLRAIYG